MSFFDTIINKAKDLFTKDTDQPAVTSAVNIAQRTAARIATPAALPAVDLATQVVNQQTKPTTVDIDFQGTTIPVIENTIPEPAPLQVVPDFQPGEAIKELDSVDFNFKYDNAQQIKAAVDAKTSVPSTVLPKIVAALPLGAQLNQSINGIGIDDGLDAITNGISWARKQADKLSQKGTEMIESGNFAWGIPTVVVWGAANLFLWGIQSVTEPAGEIYGNVNKPLEALVQQQLDIEKYQGGIFSDAKMEEYTANGNRDLYALGKQFRDNYSTEVSAGEITAGLINWVGLWLGGVGTFLTSTAITGLGGQALQLVDQTSDFGQDLSAQKRETRDIINEAEEITTNKLNLPKNFLLNYMDNEGWSSSEKNAFYSSAYYTQNQKEISKMMEKDEWIKGAYNSELSKFIDEARTPELKEDMIKELNEALQGFTDIQSDVLKKSRDNNISIKEAYELVEKDWKTNGKLDKINYADNGQYLSVFLNQSTVQGIGDQLGNRWGNGVGKVMTNVNLAAGDELLQGTSLSSLKTAYNIEKNLINTMGAITLEAYIGKGVKGIGGALEKGVAKKLGYLFAEAETPGVLTPLGSSFSKVSSLKNVGEKIIRIARSALPEGIEEVVTNPYYTMIDALQSAQPTSMGEFIASISSDFALGNLWGGLSAVQGRSNKVTEATAPSLDLAKETVSVGFDTVAQSIIQLKLFEDVQNEISNTENYGLLNEAGRTFVTEGGSIDDLSEVHFDLNAITNRSREIAKTPGIAGERSLEEQRLIVAEALASNDKIAVENAIASAQSTHTYMTQPLGGTKTWAEQLQYKGTETYEEIQKKIDERFPASPTKVKQLLFPNGDSMDAFKDIVNTTIPSNQIDFNIDKFNQSWIASVQEGFTQGKRTNTGRSTVGFYAEGVDALHTRLLQNNYTFTDTFVNTPPELAVSQFRDGLKSPDGIITTGGKTYYVKFRAPYNSTAASTINSQGEALNSIGVSTNVMKGFLYENKEDIDKLTLRVNNSGVVYGDGLLFGRITNNFMDFPGLTATNEFTFKDMDNNILFTKAIKEEVEIPGDVSEDTSNVTSFIDLFSDMTGINLERAREIEAVVERFSTVNGTVDRFLSNSMMYLIGKGYVSQNPGVMAIISTGSYNVLLDYLSSSILKDPKATKALVDFYKEVDPISSKRFLENLDDYNKNAEDYFFNEDFYNGMNDAMRNFYGNTNNISKEQMRSLVKNVYNMSSTNLIKQFVLDKAELEGIRDEVVSSNLSSWEKSKLYNVLLGVYAFANKDTSYKQNYTDENLGEWSNDVAELITKTFNSADDIKAFVAGKGDRAGIYVNSNAIAQNMMEQYLTGENTFSNLYAMEVAHITKAMWDINQYNNGTKTDLLIPTDSYVSMDNDIFQRRVDAELSRKDKGSQQDVITRWKEELLGDLYMFYTNRNETFISNFLDKINYLNSKSKTPPVQQFIDFATNLINRTGATDRKIDIVIKTYNYPHIKNYFETKDPKFVDLFNELTLDQELELFERLKDYVIVYSVDTETLPTDVQEQLAIPNSKVGDVMAEIDRRIFSESNQGKSNSKDFLLDQLQMDTPNVNELNVIRTLLSNSQYKDISATDLAVLGNAIYLGKDIEATARKINFPVKEVKRITNELTYFRAKTYAKYFSERNIGLGIFGIVPGTQLVYDKRKLEKVDVRRLSNIAGYEAVLELPFQVIEQADYEKLPASEKILSMNISNAFKSEGSVIAPPFNTNFYVEDGKLYLTANNKSTLEKIAKRMRVEYEKGTDKPQGLNDKLNQAYDRLKEKSGLEGFEGSLVLQDAYNANNSILTGYNVEYLSNEDLSNKEIQFSDDQWKSMIGIVNNSFNLDINLTDKDYSLISRDPVSQGDWIGMFSDGLAWINIRLAPFIKERTGKDISTLKGRDVAGFGNLLIESGVSAKNDGEIFRSFLSILNERASDARAINDRVLGYYNQTIDLTDFNDATVSWLERLGRTFTKLSNKKGVFNYFSTKLYQATSRPRLDVTPETSVLSTQQSEADAIEEIKRGPVNGEGFTIQGIGDQLINGGAEGNVEQGIGLLGMYISYLDNFNVSTVIYSGNHLISTFVHNYLRNGNLNSPYVVPNSMITEATMTSNKTKDVNINLMINDVVSLLDRAVKAKQYTSVKNILAAISPLLPAKYKNISWSNYLTVLSAYKTELVNTDLNFNKNKFVRILQWEQATELKVLTMKLDIPYEIKRPISLLDKRSERIPKTLAEIKNEIANMTARERLDNTKYWKNKLAPDKMYKSWPVYTLPSFDKGDMQTDVVWFNGDVQKKWVRRYSYENGIVSRDATSNKTFLVSSNPVSGIGSIYKGESALPTIGAVLGSKGINLYSMNEGDSIDLNQYKGLRKAFEENTQFVELESREYGDSQKTISFPSFVPMNTSKFYSWYQGLVWDVINELDASESVSIERASPLVADAMKFVDLAEGSTLTDAELSGIYTLNQYLITTMNKQWEDFEPTIYNSALRFYQTVWAEKIAQSPTAFNNYMLDKHNINSLAASKYLKAVSDKRFVGSIGSLKKLFSMQSIISERLKDITVEGTNNLIKKIELIDTITPEVNRSIETLSAEITQTKKDLRTAPTNMRASLRNKLAMLNAAAVEVGTLVRTDFNDELVDSSFNSLMNNLSTNGTSISLNTYNTEVINNAIKEFAESRLKIKSSNVGGDSLPVAGEYNNNSEIRKLDKQLASQLIWLFNTNNSSTIGTNDFRDYLLSSLANLKGGEVLFSDIYKLVDGAYTDDTTDKNFEAKQKKFLKDLETYYADIAPYGINVRDIAQKVVDYMNKTTTEDNVTESYIKEQQANTKKYLDDLDVKDC